jgi:hypothetical protein
MAYIGKTPVIGNFQKCDSIAVVNGQAAYTLQVGGTNVSPQSENHMLVSLNGILQAPVDSFTVSGSTLTFASNLITGDVIDFVMILGNVLDLGVPSDNTVSLAKLTATGTKDATTFLRGDNTFAEAGGGIEMADQWRPTAAIDGNDTVYTTGWERADTDGWGGIGTGMTESSGIFTFPSTGIYWIQWRATLTNTNASQYVGQFTETTLDNSTYNIASSAYGSVSGANYYVTLVQSFMFDVTNTSTHKIRFKSATPQSGTTRLIAGTGANESEATFIRLGDT